MICYQQSTTMNYGLCLKEQRSRCQISRSTLPNGERPSSRTIPRLSCKVSHTFRETNFFKTTFRNFLQDFPEFYQNFMSYTVCENCTRTGILPSTILFLRIFKAHPEKVRLL